MQSATIETGRSEALPHTLSSFRESVICKNVWSLLQLLPLLTLGFTFTFNYLDRTSVGLGFLNYIGAMSSFFCQSRVSTPNDYAGSFSAGIWTMSAVIVMTASLTASLWNLCQKSSSHDCIGARLQ